VHVRELQDKDEEDTVALNPFEDPIFYVILIVAMPVLVMVGAAQVRAGCRGVGNLVV
jgi:hypothetical protein